MRKFKGGSGSISKALTLQVKGPDFDAQYPCENARHRRVCTYNSSAGEVESDFWTLLTNYPTTW